MQELDCALDGLDSELHGTGKAGYTNLLYYLISKRHAENLAKSIEKERTKIDAQTEKGEPLTAAQVSYAKLNDELLMRLTIMMEMTEEK